MVRVVLWAALDYSQQSSLRALVLWVGTGAFMR